ncbi:MULTISPECIES: glycine betaine ABC transporter substrate-binding protein [Bacillaceae]|uniref:ABC transporter substrate-binding protein n=1 Tax=Bacillaceae TaxID=186817 RepID=UPI00064EDF9E|nr:MULTISPECIES: glycine betaine ABC transporter substrate-binding protein [Bacillaceae]KML46490.1 glycine/betaine ABC transporter substrate-binding protein [Cytobacillus firmus]MCS0654930.1 glycine betaine ABC transporter substrate-binding protein [Cytobacillus firmus]WHY33989.1 glycine betaine ABC transporter substrate-binding protein [Cytobacillus firmus]
MKRLVYLFLAIIVAATLSACGSSSANSEGGGGDSKGKLTIGGKDFTEQQILSKITSIYLKESGFDVEEASNMGSAVVRSALENGQIDIYWEYTGTGLVVYQKQEVETDPDKAYEKVKENDKKNGITWLNKANFNNTYAILMKKDTAEKMGVKTISDLAKVVNDDPDKLKFASNAEFYAREDGVKGLQKLYGFKFPSKNVVKMDSGLLYNALKDGQVDVSVGFATDGRIKGFDLVILEDDQQFFPAYNGVPVVRQEVTEESPEVSELLNKLAGLLDNETMMSLNYSVDVEHKDITEVSRNWLEEQGLVK